jgi:CMP-N,N'-diacetyllegionaminic acid synthase
MNIYSIIPARGGSKSIPHKNIRLLNGVPLINYSIKYSQNCSLISHTVVSTDSEKIAKIALNCEAEVPFLRPKALAQDETQDYPVFIHALDVLEKMYKTQIDLIVLLRPTSPLRPKGLIERGVELLKRFPEATSVRSVTESHEHPFRQWQKEGDYIKGYEKHVSEPYNIPRQKLPPVFFQTGDIEIVRRNTLIEGSISGISILPLIISYEEKLDIDHEHDLKIAEQLLTKII